MRGEIGYLDRAKSAITWVSRQLNFHVELALAARSMVTFTLHTALVVTNLKETVEAIYLPLYCLYHHLACSLARNARKEREKEEDVGEGGERSLKRHTLPLPERP